MGKKVNPDVIRVELNGWKDCRWFAYSKKKYLNCLQKDIHIRSLIDKNLSRELYSHISITRVNTRTNVNIHTHRPAAVANLVENLKKLLLVKVFNIDKSKLIKNNYNDTLNVFIVPITKPELDPNIIAINIAKQIENRVPCKVAMRKELSNTMRSGALGVKIQCSGRIEGASIARSEKMNKGSIPQQTFRLDIRKSIQVAHTVYGTVSVMVIINIPKNMNLERTPFTKRDKSFNNEEITKKENISKTNNENVQIDKGEADGSTTQQ